MSLRGVDEAKFLLGNSDILFSKCAGGKTLSVDKVGSSEGLPAVSYSARLLYFFAFKNYFAILYGSSGFVVKSVCSGNLKSDNLFAIGCLHAFAVVKEYIELTAFSDSLAIGRAFGHYVVHTIGVV